MVDVFYDPIFKNAMEDFERTPLYLKIRKAIIKIILSPEIGKPMSHNRKGTREVHVKPYRLSYSYNKEENKIILLDFYHKNDQ